MGSHEPLSSEFCGGWQHLPYVDPTATPPKLPISNPASSQRHWSRMLPAIAVDPSTT
jgi:hypothetical protein